jgi:hypothetical protein
MARGAWGALTPNSVRRSIFTSRRLYLNPTSVLTCMVTLRISGSMRKILVQGTPGAWGVRTLPVTCILRGPRRLGRCRRLGMRCTVSGVRRASRSE